MIHRNIQLPDWLIAKIAEPLIAEAKQTPYFHLEDYMNRWWLHREGARNADGSPAVQAGRIHEILRSDDDRDLHDHPFAYTTIILKGGYWEETPVDPARPAGERRREWHGPGSILQRKASDAHRLIVPAGKTATTLFMTGARIKEWGFWTPDGWVHWRRYLNIPEGLNSASVPECEGHQTSIINPYGSGPEPIGPREDAA